MKICVINGSPKGDFSVTLQSVLYLNELFDDCEFDIINAGMQIKKFEKDFSLPKEKLENCDIVLFSYPVYTFIAPAQLHRFIELIKENKVLLENKFVSQISTSKHFYDVTAHKYIEENCYDLNMKYVHGLSCDMEDLLYDKGRSELEKFFNFLIYSYKNNIYETRLIKQINFNDYIKTGNSKLHSDPKYKVAIVCDLKENDQKLKTMIDDFENNFPYETKIVNIHNFAFQGGCLGCFNCAGSGKCIYKDGFDDYLREEINSCDGIVIAFTIKDHSMGARFKLYDDRQFCNGHRTVTEGKPFAYIINGDYQNEENLRLIIEGRAEVGGNYLSGCITDANSLIQTINKFTYALENHYVKPRTFYGVGGMKIFRDLIWVMRGIMKADHVFYKKNGVYDFPQKQRGRMILMCLLGSMIRNPKIKSKMGNKFNEGMLAPYKKVLNKTKEKEKSKK